jgi:tRNA G18 (ribose-2'-O)-methylase SpoU
LVDETFSIPIYGKAESLNLSVAAGVVLYHSAFSQRG